jgi:hypothetical protein
MRRLLCWLLGHERMTSKAARRVCLRCGLRESLRDYGHIRGWEEVSRTGRHGSRV